MNTIGIILQGIGMGMLLIAMILLGEGLTYYGLIVIGFSFPIETIGFYLNVK